MSRPVWDLSPSDFGFLWQECKRCFWLKVRENFKRPERAMPAVFGTIDREMKRCFLGKPTSSAASEMPAGVFRYGEKWVHSKTIEIEGRDSVCRIRGKFDTVAELKDGSYAVLDFKTSEVKPTHVDRYAAQLHAYAYALENPGEGKLRLAPVSRLGLLVFSPKRYEHAPERGSTLEGSLRWLEIPRNEPSFLRFLGRILELLDLPEPPEASEACGFCRYREEARKRGQ